MNAGGDAYRWVRLLAILAGVAVVIFLVVKLYGWISTGAGWAWSKAKEVAGVVKDGVVAPTSAVVSGLAATGNAALDLVTTGTVSQSVIDAGRAASAAVSPPIDMIMNGTIESGMYLD